MLLSILKRKVEEGISKPLVEENILPKIHFPHTTKPNKDNLPLLKLNVKLTNFLGFHRIF